VKEARLGEKKEFFREQKTGKNSRKKRVRTHREGGTRLSPVRISKKRRGKISRCERGRDIEGLKRLPLKLEGGKTESPSRVRYVPLYNSKGRFFTLPVWNNKRKKDCRSTHNVARRKKEEEELTMEGQYGKKYEIVLRL